MMSHKWKIITLENELDATLPFMKFWKESTDNYEINFTYSSLNFGHRKSGFLITCLGEWVGVYNQLRKTDGTYQEFVEAVCKYDPFASEGYRHPDSCEPFLEFVSRLKKRRIPHKIELFFEDNRVSPDEFSQSVEKEIIQDYRELSRNIKSIGK